MTVKAKSAKKAEDAVRKMFKDKISKIYIDYESN